jgi:uncharacterized protein YjbI with pentapeptide repeats
MAAVNPSSAKSSVVRIFYGDNSIAGTGFLISARHVLTCAQVVGSALDLRNVASRLPQGEIRLDFPYLSPGAYLGGKVVLWQSFDPALGAWQGGIACLELNQPLPPGARVARMVKFDDLWQRRFVAVGFPADAPSGKRVAGQTLAQETTGWLQVDDMAAGAKLLARPGFGGAPLWDDRLGEATGMLVTRYPGKTGLCAVSFSGLMDAWLRPVAGLFSESESRPASQRIELVLDEISGDAGSLQSRIGSLARDLAGLLKVKGDQVEVLQVWSGGAKIVLRLPTECAAGFLQMASRSDASLRRILPALQSFRLVVEDAYLQRVMLDGANLRGVDLGGTDLRQASLVRADLANASLANANLLQARLSGANLDGADLEGADLSQAYLDGARLPRADLAKANLEAAILSKAALPAADLADARLGAAGLAGAELSGADLRRADLSEADLRGAELSGAILADATLNQANLKKAALNDANLTGAKLAWADLCSASMKSTDLAGADLRRADLTSANLTSANLSGADLSWADLTSANLTSADLSNAILTGADLTSATTNVPASAPLAVGRPAAGQAILYQAGQVTEFSALVSGHEFDFQQGKMDLQIKPALVGNLLCSEIGFLARYCPASWKALAGSPRIPAQSLRLLYRQNPPDEIKAALAGNPLSPRDVLDGLVAGVQARQSKDRVYWQWMAALTRNPSLSANNLDVLADQVNLVDNYRGDYARAILEHPRTTTNTVEKLSKHTDVQVRRSVAGAEQTPQTELTRLATDPDAPVRRAVAGNPSTSDQDLNRLSSDATPSTLPAVGFTYSANEIQQAARRNFRQRTPPAPAASPAAAAPGWDIPAWIMAGVILAIAALLGLALLVLVWIVQFWL